MRWDLVTRFEVIKKGSHARAVKNFSGREDFFSEHFPGNPLVPEPFFIEMIAQTGGVLFGLALDFKKEVILAKIEDARFFLPVRPPCEFLIEAKVEKSREDGAWVAGTVSFGDKIVAQARILLIAVEGLIEGKKSIVFNEHFMKTYDILAVARKSEEARVP